MDQRVRPTTRGWSPGRGFLAFAASVFVFHQLPALLPTPAGEAVDLLTPFAVIAASAVLLAALDAPPPVLVFGLVAAILYVDGHGLHLSANAIHNAGPLGEAERVTYFWDERFSHVESLLGWFGLVAAFCLGERAVPRATDSTKRGTLALAAVLLGVTFFTSTVEGQTWPLLLAVAPVFALWALRSRRPLVVSAAAAYALAVALVGVWALAHGGVPEFSDLELI